MAGKGFGGAALLVQTENHYGVREIVGQFVAPQDTGELYNISWSSYEIPRELRALADLTIRAYVGGTSMVSEPDGGRIWGRTVGYADVHRIEQVEHAKAISQTLSRIDRGLNRLNDKFGYVPDDDFHGYVMRVASTLGVTGFYVRQFRRAETRSGNKYRQVDPSALQWYIGSVSNLAKERDYAELNERQ